MFWPLTKKKRNVEKVGFSGVPSLGNTVEDRMFQAIFHDISPALIESLRESPMSGNFKDMETIWRTMKGDWYRLLKNVEEVSGNVSRLPFEINPYQEKGKKVKPRDQEYARVVEKALWADNPRAGTRELGLKNFIRACCEIPLRGHGVVEILWGKSGNLVYPRAYFPISADFYRFPNVGNMSDRLMLCPDGIGYGEDVDFNQDKFIVGLKMGSFDHPLFNAKFRPLLIFYCMSRFGPKWLMTYCQKYGIPSTHIKTTGDDEAKRKLAKMVNEMAANGTIVTGPDDEINPLDMARALGGLPHKDAIELADQVCDNFILGQQLTSSTQGVGSQALGKVHNSVRIEVLADHADFAVDLINNQLIPAILKLNFGTVPENRPYLTYTIPQGDEDEKKLDRLERLKRLGAKMTEEYVMSQAGLPEPAKGDTLFEPVTYGASPLDRSGDEEPEENPPKKKPEEKEVTAARELPWRKKKIRVADQDAIFLEALAEERLSEIKKDVFKPIAEGLEALIALAEDETVTEDDFEEHLHNFWNWILDNGAIDKKLLEEELFNLQFVASVLGWNDHIRGTQEISAWKSSGRGIPCGFGYISPDKVCRINERIDNLVEDALKTGDGKTINTGCRIPDSVAGRYGTIWGHDCRGAKINLNTSQIRHIEERHGKGKEYRENQLPILPEDYRWVPKIVGYPSKIISEVETRRGKKCTVIKRTPAKTFVAVLTYKRKWNSINVVTMWAFKPKRKPLH